MPEPLLNDPTDAALVLIRELQSENSQLFRALHNLVLHYEWHLAWNDSKAPPLVAATVREAEALLTRLGRTR